MPGGPHRNQSRVGKPANPSFYPHSAGPIGEKQDGEAQAAASNGGHHTTASQVTHRVISVGNQNDTSDSGSLSSKLMNSASHPVLYHPDNATHDVEECPKKTTSYDLRTLLKRLPTFRLPVRSSRYALRQKSTSVNPDITLVELKKDDAPTNRVVEYVLTTLCCNYQPSQRKYWLCMFDIDNTLAVNSREGGTVYAITPLCWLLQHLMRAGFPIVLFTARSHAYDVIDYTKHSLERMGIPWNEMHGLYFLPMHVDVDRNLSSVAKWKHSIREELILDRDPKDKFHPPYNGCAFAVGDNWFDLFPYDARASLNSLDQAFPQTHVLVRHLHPTGEDDKKPVPLLQYQHKRPTRAKHNPPHNDKEYPPSAYTLSIPKIMLKLPHEPLDESFYAPVYLSEAYTSNKR
jgi:hypothetical protein